MRPLRSRGKSWCLCAGPRLAAGGPMVHWGARCNEGTQTGTRTIATQRGGWLRELPDKRDPRVPGCQAGADHAPQPSDDGAGPAGCARHLVQGETYRAGDASERTDGFICQQDQRQPVHSLGRPNGGDRPPPSDCPDVVDAAGEAVSRRHLQCHCRWLKHGWWHHCRTLRRADKEDLGQVCECIMGNTQTMARDD